MFVILTQSCWTICSFCCCCCFYPIFVLFFFCQNTKQLYLFACLLATCFIRLCFCCCCKSTLPFPRLFFWKLKLKNEWTKWARKRTNEEKRRQSQRHQRCIRETYIGKQFLNRMQIPRFFFVCYFSFFLFLCSPFLLSIVIVIVVAAKIPLNDAREQAATTATIRWLDSIELNVKWQWKLTTNENLSSNRNNNNNNNNKNNNKQ